MLLGLNWFITCSPALFLFFRATSLPAHFITRRITLRSFNILFSVRAPHMAQACRLLALLPLPLFADSAWFIRLANPLVRCLMSPFVATCWRYRVRAFRLPPIILRLTGLFHLFSAFVDVDTLQYSIRLYSLKSNRVIFFFLLPYGRFCARLLLSLPRPTEVLLLASAGRGILIFV